MFERGTKMKKSLMALILATALILTMAACTVNSGTPTTAEDAASSQASGEAGADAAAPEAATEVEPASDGETYQLTFASIFPSGSPYDTKILTYIDEQLKEKSGGRLSLEVYAGESLVSAANCMDAVASGMADVGIMYMAAAPGRYPVSQIFELPYYYASAAAPTYAYNEFYKEYPEAFEEFSSVKILALYCSGPAALISQEKIPNVASYSGYQISSQSTTAPAVTLLGGTPISNVLPEVYECLRTGVVDGYIGAYESVYAWSFYEVVEYCTAFPMLNGTHAMFMNPDTFDGLPTDLQLVLEEVIKDTLDTQLAAFFDDEGVYGLTYCKEQGLEFYDLDPGTLDEMLDKTSPLIDDYADELNALGYDGAAMIVRFKELMDEYNELYPYRYDEFIKIQ